MLQRLRLGPVSDLPSAQLVPPILVPLIRAAQHGEDVAPVTLAIAQSFGFEGLWYGVSLSLRPTQETRQFVFSSWPDELSRIYDERAFIEVDPRVREVTSSSLPLFWDQTTYRGQSPEIDAFFDVLKSYGSLSGVMCSLRDSRGCLAALSLTCAVPVFDEVRKIALARQMGDILVFQRYFHEIFVRGVLNEYVPAHREGSRLSRRERECLTMAARGLTGEDIAIKLSISLRTVQHHFDSIRSKLGAANRQEAIYRATRSGEIAV
jgi:LuxR family quorum-sensing system transcriptional regulator SolR